MEHSDILRDIKKELRANMNGVASKLMREGGLQYHVNFGIELPRLQQIAHEFEPNHQVAQQLWNENVRESKILATILMPLDNYHPEVADIWVDEIPNAEIASLAVMNLFSRLPYASTLAFQWIAAENEMRQLCGFLILARLKRQGGQFNEHSLLELKDQAEACFQDASLPLKKAILAATE